jgi:ketosteroid isomerase-like protein
MSADRNGADSDMPRNDFDSAVEGYRRALEHYMTGDPRPVTKYFSRRGDVTLANPLGPPRVGPAEVDRAIADGASHLKDGSVRNIEEVSRYSTADLGYVVQVERTQARVDGSESVLQIALRVTMIFRREGDAWLVAHRHADPITSARQVSSTIES